MRIYLFCLIFLFGCARELAPDPVEVQFKNENPGDNCENGGIHVVIDDVSEYICNGENGSNGDNGTNGVDGVNGLNGKNGENGDNGDNGDDARPITFRFDEEPLGDNCGYGGTLVSGGFDLDGDGELDDNEVTSTSYVCNGSGACTVIDNEDSTRTISCDDGTEVLIPSVPASGVLQGDYVLKNSLDAAFLKDFTEITGYLMMDKLDGISNLDNLANITTIGDDLYLRNTGTLVDLSGLSNISTIGGSLYVTSNTEFTDLSGLNGITSIGEWLFISSNQSLPTCEAERLRDNIGVGNIGGSIEIENNDDTGMCN